MEDKNILKIAIISIIYFVIALNISEILNDLFTFINTSILLEHAILLAGIHITLGVATAILIIRIYNSFLKDKIPSMTTIGISIGALVLIVFIAIMMTTLSTVTLVTNHSNYMSIYATHHSFSIVSSQIAMPLTLLVYFMLKVLKKDA